MAVVVGTPVAYSGAERIRTTADLLVNAALTTSVNTTVATAFAWVTETTSLSASFVAPPSGRVEVTFSGYLIANTAGVSVLHGYKISGGLTRDPTTDESLRIYFPATGAGAVRASVSYFLTGLTAGTSYTLTSACTASSAGASVATVQDRRLSVKAF